MYVQTQSSQPYDTLKRELREAIVSFSQSLPENLTDMKIYALLSISNGSCITLKVTLKR